MVSHVSHKTYRQLCRTGKLGRQVVPSWAILLRGILNGTFFWWFRGFKWSDHLKPQKDPENVSCDRGFAVRRGFRWFRWVELFRQHTT
jgi:hypothetical protein